MKGTGTIYYECVTCHTHIPASYLTAHSRCPNCGGTMFQSPETRTSKRVKYTVNVGTGEASGEVVVEDLQEATILRAIFNDLYDTSYEVLDE